MPLVYDDEPGSWGRLSEGWPEIVFRFEAEYIEAWRFCVKGNDGKKPIPYGSYVDVSAYENCKHVAPFKIRFETQEYVEKVQAHMRRWIDRQSRPPRRYLGLRKGKPPNGP